MASRRGRNIILAVLVSILICAGVLGFNRFTHWRNQRALTHDINAILVETTQQLQQSLISRRGTLTFIRDTLNRQAMNPEQLVAVGASATEHTRHLMGTGIIREGQSPQWWFGPKPMAPAELKELNKAIVQRSKLRGAWSVPSTLVGWVTDKRPILIMLEPLSTARMKNTAVIGVFDLVPLLRDFFSSGLPQRHPAQVLTEGTLLHRSKDWDPFYSETLHAPPLNTETLHMDAVRWQVQMQPGATSVIKTLSWVTIVLVSASGLVALAVIVLIWLLVTRTWVLQQAVRRRTAALRRTTERLRQLATTDELTGLYNRRFFMQRWLIECERAKRYGRPLACLMIDVNKFKQVNDSLGHDVGDTLLIAVSRQLRQTLRQTDLLARFGGDEFIVALPETSAADAISVANKLRQVAIPIEAKPLFPPITLSVGVACNHGRPTEPESLVKAADEALYHSKQAARQSALAVPADI
jgi:diguanylate cyclase (GGDEF)-like protein